MVLSCEVGETRSRYAEAPGQHLHHQGELTRWRRSRRLYHQCAIDEKALLAETYSGFGHLRLAQGDIADEKRRYTDALAIRQASVKGSIADSTLDLAAVAIEEGRYGEGEQLARQAVATYGTLEEADSVAAAYVVLARALVAQAKSTGAQAAIDRAVNSARATQDQIVRVNVATTAARVAAASRNARAIASSIEA